jgi:hypothetical protein
MQTVCVPLSPARAVSLHARGSRCPSCSPPRANPVGCPSHPQAWVRRPSCCPPGIPLRLPNPVCALSARSRGGESEARRLWRRRAFSQLKTGSGTRRGRGGRGVTGSGGSRRVQTGDSTCHCDEGEGVKTRPGGQNSRRPADDEATRRATAPARKLAITKHYITFCNGNFLAASVCLSPLQFSFSRSCALQTLVTRLQRRIPLRSACVSDGEGLAGRGKSGVLCCPSLRDAERRLLPTTARNTDSACPPRRRQQLQRVQQELEDARNVVAGADELERRLEEGAPVESDVDLLAIRAVLAQARKDIPALEAQLARLQQEACKSDQSRTRILCPKSR